MTVMGFGGRLINYCHIFPAAMLFQGHDTSQYAQVLFIFKIKVGTH